MKQLDGSWRWLSAWGLVEFEGQGVKRKPIAGASRDLSERKQAEELQRLLAYNAHVIGMVESVYHLAESA